MKNCLCKKLCNSPERVIFLSFFLISLIAVIGVEIIRIDVRFALMVQEINRYGVGVFPTINGMPYVDYPVTYTLFSWLTSLGGRAVNLAALALPTILLGAFSMALIYRIGERLKAGVGAWAVALLVISYEFGQLFTGFGIDIPVMAAGVVMGDLLTSKPSLKRDLPIFALLLLCVFFIRGPFGIILLGGGTGAWLLLSGRFKEILPFAVTGAVTTALCAAAGYALILKQGGRELLELFYEWQIGSRMNTPPNHHPFYFLTNAMLSFAPVGLAAMATVILKFRPLVKDALWRGIFGFALIIPAILGIPACKHLRYMSIALPFLALIAGYGALEIPEKWRKKLLSVLTVIVATALLILSLLFLLPVLGLETGKGHFILAALAALAALLTRKKVRSANGKLFAACALVFIAEAWVIFPVTASLEYSQRFVDRCEKLRAGHKICFYQLGPDHQDNIYVLKMPPAERDKVIRSYLKIKPGSSQNMYRKVTFDEAAKQLAPGDCLLAEVKRAREFDTLLKKHKICAEELLTGQLGRKPTRLYRIVATGENK